MKANTVRQLVLVALLGVAVSGCSTMNWIFGDWNYELGHAQTANASKMIANPDRIDAEAKSIEGIDGETGEAVMTQYERQQTQRQSAPKSSIINIGTGSR